MKIYKSSEPYIFLALLLSAIGCAASLSGDELRLPAPLDAIQPAEDGLRELLHILGPGQILLSGEGEGPEPGNQVMVRHRLEVTLMRRHTANSLAVLAGDSYNIGVIRIEFEPPIDPSEVVEHYGRYSLVPCRVKLLPGELEGVLVRAEPDEEEIDVEMLVFAGGRLVAEKYGDEVAALRFLGRHYGMQGDSCP